jgi:hypothetical protein
MMPAAFQFIVGVITVALTAMTAGPPTSSLSSLPSPSPLP